MVAKSRESLRRISRHRALKAIVARRKAQRKQTVLFTISNPQRLSGSNKSLLTLIVQLKDAIRPVICLTGEGEMSGACRQLGLEVLVLKTFAVFQSKAKPLRTMSLLQLLQIAVLQYPIFLFQSWRLLRSVRPDVIHANDPKSTLFWGLAARLCAVPVMSHLRGEKPFSGLAAKVYERIPQRFIAVSHATKNNLSGSAQKRTAVIYNGVTVVDEESLQDESHIQWLSQLRQEGRTVVGCVASVVPFKGLHHLCDAIAKLPAEKRNDVVVVIVGDIINAHQDYYHFLLLRCRQQQLVNISFSGWQADIDAIYRSIDILVLPSVSREVLTLGETIHQVRGSEGLPRSILEAMSFGLPVVASNVAGVCEQIEHGKSGLIFPPGDSAALADCLGGLIGDKSLQTRMGEQAKLQVTPKFSVQQQALQFLALCRGLRKTQHENVRFVGK